MVQNIGKILENNEPSIYLYGSSVLDDFRVGWSDIDILVLTRESISEKQAETLVLLRQAMLEREPDNRYYRSFEGGMLGLSAFLTGESDRVVYWGTSGQRITDAYMLDSFDMAGLLKNGVLLHGRDVRSGFLTPSYSALCSDVKRRCETVRMYAQRTKRSIYSFGWLLDISRCIYTLRTGGIIAKTAAGEWALREGVCPDAEALETALDVRRNPDRFRGDAAVEDRAELLGECVQRYAGVLEKELEARAGY